MADRLLIALAQINPIVGDIDHNVAAIRGARATAAAMGADLVVYPELCLIGYPPEDLVLKPFFERCADAAVEELAADTADGGPAMLVSSCRRSGDKLYNAALLLADGKVLAERAKHHLPNYGVFDELRVFDAGPLPGPMALNGVRLGVMTCEDMWHGDVAECLLESGAEILVVLNGSPYEVDKTDRRMNHAVARAVETQLPLVFVNQVGGQDELVFDGISFVLNADRSLALQAPAWIEDVRLSRWARDGDGWRCDAGEIVAHPEGDAAIYQAMMLGLRDYVNKNRFPGIVLGLSGGVDSALSAAVAVDALGADRVRTVMLPSRYTSDESLEDAAACARLLGVRLDEIAIEPAVTAFGDMLAPQFAGTQPGLTEENLQSRIRGVALMALSNKFGPMVLTTGNKSEMSVGYATLYGDMCGGYSVLKDVYKTTVFALARWRNDHLPPNALGPKGMVIPERIITKPPSAELRPDQKDEDSLPAYHRLDAILHALIEEEASFADIVARGFDPEVVAKVEHLLYVAEYKRRQAPPGVKITSRAFGRDRRYPITNGFRSQR